MCRVSGTLCKKHEAFIHFVLHRIIDLRFSLLHFNVKLFSFSDCESIRCFRQHGIFFKELP